MYRLEIHLIWVYHRVHEMPSPTKHTYAMLVPCNGAKSYSTAAVRHILQLLGALHPVPHWGSVLAVGHLSLGPPVGAALLSKTLQCLYELLVVLLHTCHVQRVLMTYKLSTITQCCCSSVTWRKCQNVKVPVNSELCFYSDPNYIPNNTKPNTNLNRNLSRKPLYK